MVVKLDAKEAIRSTVARLRQYLSQEGVPKLSEADTKANFVEKYIAALGYEGLADIVREYYVKNSQEFIDYVLKCLGKAVLAIEAKPLQSDLTDKHAAQLVQYCAVEGIEWSVLTNAREFRLFNQYIKGDLESKLVLKLDLLAFNSDEDYDVIFEQLWLLSKESMSAPTGIKTWLEQRCLDRSIRSALLNPASIIVKTLRKELVNSADLQVTHEAIVQWFQSQLTANVVTVPPPKPVYTNQLAGKEPAVKESLGSLEKYWLLPVARGKDGCRPVEQLHRWLDKSMWGMGESTPGRKHLRIGDRVCFYATKVGIVAVATVAGTAETLVTPEEWPEPYLQQEPVFKVPLAAPNWLATPIHLDEELRQKLDAFREKKPSRKWSWFVQTTSRLTARDFYLLTAFDSKQAAW